LGRRKRGRVGDDGIGKKGEKRESREGEHVRAGGGTRPPRMAKKKGAVTEKKGKEAPFRQESGQLKGKGNPKGGGMGERGGGKGAMDVHMKKSKSRNISGGGM